MNKIDFVILWVDGNDPEWVKDRSKYIYEKSSSTAISKNRFRDWKILNYWFRAVEKYATWVNKIWFVTYGHIPSWLNTNNEKIQVIKHEQFIPKEYLPTFNSNTIILNLHRINGISENFVLFNDDMFILDKVLESDFFTKNNLPRDFLAFNLISPTGNRNDSFNHMKINNINVINNYYSKREIVKKDFFKLYNMKNGLKNNLKTLCLTSWSKITGFVDPHIPYSYSKKYFEKIWNIEFQLLHSTCLNKFRSNQDVTDWLIRYFQLCDGFFKTRKYNYGAYFELHETNDELCKHIKSQKTKLICINDVYDVKCEDKIVKELTKAFDTILPDKSNFEI